MPPVPLAFEKEKFNEAVQLCDGVWVIAVPHNPGGNPSMPSINNRCFVFRVKASDGKESLLAVGLNNLQLSGKAVDQIIQDTGLQLTHMVSQGAIHMMAMPAWIDKFPGAVAYVEPFRIPELTSVGREMFANHGPQKTGRIKALPKTGAIFPEFAGQLELHLLKGIGVHKDIDASTKCGLLCNMRELNNNVGGPGCEVYAFHPPSGLLLVGDNMGWYYPKEYTIPSMLKMQGLKNDVFMCNKKAMGVLDYPVVKESWEEILKCDIQIITGYHEQPTVAIKENAKERLRRAVTDAGQLEGKKPGGCTIM